MFTLKIKTDGSAFHDEDVDEVTFIGYSEIEEVVRILREAADKLEWGQEFGKFTEFGVLKDFNGNYVGEFRFKR